VRARDETRAPATPPRWARARPARAPTAAIGRRDLPPDEGGSTSTDAKPGTTPDGATGPANGPDKPNCKYQAHKTGLTQLQQAGGLSFNVYAPPSYDPKVGHTVVVIMHGQDSNGVPELTALWQPIADTAGENLVLVAPKGSRAATNGDATAGNWATADLNHVTEIMALVDDCYDVFPKKHILWGFSEGCFYGYLLGIGAADSFSASRWAARTPPSRATTAIRRRPRPGKFR